MATKKQDSINLIEIFKDFKEFKNIDKQTLINVLEESFRSVIAKMYGTDANYDVIINPDKGDLEVYRNRLVMEDDDVANENTQIALSDALKLDDEAEVGEEVTDRVDFSVFGRRMILNLRQTLATKILDLKKEDLYMRYSEKLGQIVSGELYQVWKKEMLLLDEENKSLALVEMIFRDMIGIPKQSGSKQCRERHIVMDERNTFDAVDGEIPWLSEGQAANHRLFPDGVDMFVKLEFMRHLARVHLITPHFCMVLDDREVIRVAQRCQIVLGGDVACGCLNDEFVGFTRLSFEGLLRNENHATAVGFLFNIRNRVVAAKHENAVDFGQNILVVAPLMDR